MKKKQAVRRNAGRKAKRPTKKRAVRRNAGRKMKRTTKRVERRRSSLVAADATIQIPLEVTQEVPAQEVLGEIEESLALSKLSED